MPAINPAPGSAPNSNLTSDVSRLFGEHDKDLQTLFTQQQHIPAQMCSVTQQAHQQSQQSSSADTQTIQPQWNAQYSLGDWSQRPVSNMDENFVLQAMVTQYTNPELVVLSRNTILDRNSNLLHLPTNPVNWLNTTGGPPVAHQNIPSLAQPFCTTIPTLPHNFLTTNTPADPINQTYQLDTTPLVSGADLLVDSLAMNTTSPLAEISNSAFLASPSQQNYKNIITGNEITLADMNQYHGSVEQSGLSTNSSNFGQIHSQIADTMALLELLRREKEMLLNGNAGNPDVLYGMMPLHCENSPNFGSDGSEPRSMQQSGSGRSLIDIQNMLANFDGTPQSGHGSSTMYTQSASASVAVTPLGANVSGSASSLSSESSSQMDIMPITFIPCQPPRKFTPTSEIAALPSSYHQNQKENLLQLYRLHQRQHGGLRKPSPPIRPTSLLAFPLQQPTSQPQKPETTSTEVDLESVETSSTIPSHTDSLESSHTLSLISSDVCSSMYRGLSQFDDLPPLPPREGLNALLRKACLEETFYLLPIFYIGSFIPSAAPSFIQHALIACATRFTKDHAVGMNCFERARRQVFDILRPLALASPDDPSLSSSFLEEYWDGAGMQAGYIQHPQSSSSSLSVSGPQRSTNSYCLPQQLSALAALLYLICYCNISGDPKFQHAGKAWSVVAAKIARRLGLNREIPESENVTWVEREMRRRLWWCLHIQENVMMISADHRPSLTLADSQLRIISDKASWSADVEYDPNVPSLPTERCAPYMNDVLTVMKHTNVAKDWERWLYSSISPTIDTLRNGGLPISQAQSVEEEEQEELEEQLKILKPFHVRMFALAALLGKANALSRRWEAERLEPWLGEFYTPKMQSTGSEATLIGSSDFERPSKRSGGRWYEHEALDYWAEKSGGGGFHPLQNESVAEEYIKANRKAARDLRRFRSQLCQWYYVDSRFHAFRGTSPMAAGRLNDGVLRVLQFHICYVFSHSPQWAVLKMVNSAHAYIASRGIMPGGYNGATGIRPYCPLLQKLPRMMQSEFAPRDLQNAERVLVRWASSRSQIFGGGLCEKNAYNIAAWCHELLYTTDPDELKVAAEKRWSFLGVSGYMVFYACAVYTCIYAFRRVVREREMEGKDMMWSGGDSTDGSPSTAKTASPAGSDPFEPLASGGGGGWFAPMEADSRSTRTDTILVKEFGRAESASEAVERERAASVARVMVKALRAMAEVWEARGKQMSTLLSWCEVIGLDVD
ncbi:hypothetical protein BJ742DRAFT_848292 [Cladochytrium replicatum]|nr:hypothetical protein BJ742DRAFT_848292 [Cladochytrium replicatum]